MYYEHLCWFKKLVYLFFCFLRATWPYCKKSIKYTVCKIVILCLVRCFLEKNYFEANWTEPCRAPESLCDRCQIRTCNRCLCRLVHGVTRLFTPSIMRKNYLGPLHYEQAKLFLQNFPISRIYLQTQFVVQYANTTLTTQTPKVKYDCHALTFKNHLIFFVIKQVFIIISLFSFPPRTFFYI